jgi:hypothetical protein
MSMAPASSYGQYASGYPIQFQPVQHGYYGMPGAQPHQETMVAAYSWINQQPQPLPPMNGRAKAASFSNAVPYTPTSETVLTPVRHNSQRGRSRRQGTITDVHQEPFMYTAVPGNSDSAQIAGGATVPWTCAIPSKIWVELTNNGCTTMTFQEAVRNIPFDDNARRAKPPYWGVIKMTNVPYDVTKQEVLSYLGRSAKVITANFGCPVHIIMERSTGKTMDVFVELFSYADAHNIVEKIKGYKATNKQTKIGDRHVEVDMSSQQELMQALFPKARCLEWHGAEPQLLPPREAESGFKYFITQEELVMTVQWAEAPKRVCNAFYNPH